MSFLSTIRPFFRAAGQTLIDLLFPAFCFGCGYEGTFLCEDCFSRLWLLEAHSWPMSDYALDRFVALGSYRDNILLPQLIHALKYDFVTDLAEPLGKLMVKAFSDCGFTDVVLVPVPLHPRRQRWRGFNQAELLARHVAAATGMTEKPLLERIHFCRPQMELSKEERLRNVEGAFIPNPRLFDTYMQQSCEGKNFLLVDDVATTLSTLHSCAKTLRMGGAQNVSALVLASDHH